MNIKDTPVVTEAFISQVKREAKVLRKDYGLRHSQALDIVAKSHGFQGYIGLLRAKPKE